MQTIKTAVVVVLLLGVCYGAYVAMNAPEPTLPPDLEAWSEGDAGLSVETGALVDVPQLSPSAPPADLAPLVPPAIAQPTTPAPTLPSSPPSLGESSFGQVPPPPPAFPLELDAQKKESLESKLLTDSNKQPELPEGTSIPLPGTETETKIDNLAGSPPELSLPPAPELPGFEAPSLPSATPNDQPTGPGSNSLGLLAPNGQPGSDSMPKPPATLNDPKASKTAMPYAMAHKQALELTADNKLKAALELMSPYFDHITLEEAEHRDLRQLLDALAAEVIYSKRHLIENRFIVSPGESLESIANKFHVSPETLASINRLENPKILLPGTELKVFNGPFRAEVDLSRGELVMYLGDLYAGIFPVTVGNTPAPQLGTFTVVEKLRNRSYHTAKPEVFSASDPRNPYGGYWIHLGNEVCIHGSPEVSDPALKDAGCISLAPLDARDVYSLLGQGSEVKIKE